MLLLTVLQFIVLFVDIKKLGYIVLVHNIFEQGKNGRTMAKIYKRTKRVAPNDFKEYCFFEKMSKKIKTSLLQLNCV